VSDDFDLETFLSNSDERGVVVAYRKGDAVFSQGEEANAVFYITEGSCKVSILSQRGKEAVIALPRKGDFFGEGCLSGQRRRIATVAATSAARIMKIGRKTMLGLLRDQPLFSELFMAHLLARNVRVEADLVDQLFNSSERRLARLLLLMANFGKEECPEPVIAQMSQELLADMVGTTRSRVSFFMNKFRRLGFIEYDVGGARLKVHSSLLNVILHDDPEIRTGFEV
jgi:CRP/FNR family transcriptional regulator, cyclic AMP receptor protein